MIMHNIKYNKISKSLQDTWNVNLWPKKQVFLLLNMD
jgi:hypothetical protein